MRYPKDHGQQTRRRIVENASHGLSQNGVDGLSVADLMKLADLTHGSFYAYFKSRDSLVLEALALAMDRTVAHWLDLTQGLPARHSSGGRSSSFAPSSREQSHGSVSGRRHLNSTGAGRLVEPSTPTSEDDARVDAAEAESVRNRMLHGCAPCFAGHDVGGREGRSLECRGYRVLSEYLVAGLPDDVSARINAMRASSNAVQTDVFSNEGKQTSSP